MVKKTETVLNKLNGKTLPGESQDFLVVAPPCHSWKAQKWPSMNIYRREDSDKLEMQSLYFSYDDNLPYFYNWNYNCLRTGLCTNILCYCFLCASCWKNSYNYILVILPNDKSSIWRVLHVKLKKSRTFQAKYFHNAKESIMAAMINKSVKSVVKTISRACATHETAPSTTPI